MLNRELPIITKGGVPLRPREYVALIEVEEANAKDSTLNKKLAAEAAKKLPSRDQKQQA